MAPSKTSKRPKTSENFTSLPAAGQTTDSVRAPFFLSVLYCLLYVEIPNDCFFVSQSDQWVTQWSRNCHASAQERISEKAQEGTLMGRYFIALYTVVFILVGVMATPARADSTATPASIDTFVFTACNTPLTGTCAPGGLVYTWEAPSSPTPTPSIACQPNGTFLGCVTVFADVAVNGSDFGLTTIRFGSPNSQDGLGGFEISALGLNEIGAQLFSGSVSSPTFVPGTYPMFASDLPSPPTGTLIISTPEPTTLLSLLGLGALSLIGIRLKSKPRSFGSRGARV
jgi:hypothetical protein